MGITSDPGMDAFEETRVGTQRGLRIKASLLDIAKAHASNDRVLIAHGTGWLPSRYTPPVEPHQIIFCDNVYRDEDGRQAVTGIFTGLGSTSFPLGVPAIVLFVAFRTFRKDADLSVAVSSPNGTEILRAPVRSEGAPQSPDSGHQIFVRLINFQFPAPGAYLFVFYDGSRPVAQRTMLVAKIQTDEGEPAEAEA